MSTPRAILVIDLAFGDCGKGTIVDYLAHLQGAQTVVRFNGGPQAGHNVVTPDGRHHTFSQFGAATFVPGVRTILSRFMVIEPYALLNEASHLRQLRVTDALDRLTIDERCPVITPAHQAANRLREIARGANAHGTCGMGFGEAVGDQIERPETMIYARDLADGDLLARKLREICRSKHAALANTPAGVACDFASVSAMKTLSDLSWIDAAVENYTTIAKCATIADQSAMRDVLRESQTTIYEGAQGVLLDQQFGFHPHTTWSKTTFANADSILKEIGFDGATNRIGVLRSYFTRHGSGPFVTEGKSLIAQLPEPHNLSAGWQGDFRVGIFDAVAAKYALRCCGGVDALAITHLDRVANLPPSICTAYLRDGKPVELSPETTATELKHCQPRYTEFPKFDPGSFASMVRDLLDYPIAIRSIGPTCDDKISE